MDKGYYFYVLYCQDATLYAGFTTDLARRLATHNAGKGAKYTRLKSRRPVKLVYAESWANKSLAMSAEAKFKGLTRAEKLTYLALNGQTDLLRIPCVIVNNTIREETNTMFLGLRGIQE